MKVFKIRFSYEARKWVVELKYLKHILFLMLHGWQNLLTAFEFFLYLSLYLFCDFVVAYRSILVQPVATLTILIVKTFLDLCSTYLFY